MNDQNESHAAATRSQGSSKCPVDYGKTGSPGSWWVWRGSANTHISMATEETTLENKDARPTVVVDPSPYASIEEAEKYSQSPQQDQRYRLGTMRQVSSIPRGRLQSTAIDHGEGGGALPTAGRNVELPHHQAGTGAKLTHWVYPSEQQLLNAMRRKGWTNVAESSVPVVLQIHNAVNESTWQKLLEYHRCPGPEPRLVRFQGRPNDLSPKAYLWTRLFGFPKPFDRHDWHVEYYQKSMFFGGGGRWIEQRYVIDFYERPRGSHSGSPAQVDVRPALDSPRSVWLHTKRMLQLSFPGITSYWYKSVNSRFPPREGSADRDDLGRAPR
jgi:cytochrome c heme-lyase